MENHPGAPVNSLSIVERYAMYNAFYNESNHLIRITAKFVGISEEIVRNALKYVPTPTVPRKLGRKSILGERELLFIEVPTMGNRRITGQKLANEILVKFNTEVSAKTVILARELIGYEYKSPLRSVFMLQDALAKRIDLCHKQLNDGTDWSRVIFSDESIFELQECNKKLWRKPGEQEIDVRCSQRAHPQKWMIWCAIGHNFKSSIVFVDTTINSEVYTTTIIKNFVFVETQEEHLEMIGYCNKILRAPSGQINIERTSRTKHSSIKRLAAIFPRSEHY
jgi:hypothetical protein